MSVLLTLADEAVAFVEIDAAGGGFFGAAMVEGDGALEDVGVVGGGGVGTRDPGDIAELGEKMRVNTPSVGPPSPMGSRRAPLTRRNQDG